MPDYTYEESMKKQGFKTVCGIDEAGRGPLAGPVFSAAVILPENCIIEGLDDSKKLTAKKRELLFDEITQKAVSYGIASASETEIDEINILQATFLAMNRAVKALNITPDAALVDGNSDPSLPMKTDTVIKGDSKSMSIAAASVLAKVSRDRYMLKLAEEYPQYQFEKHKGYGTKLHYEMIKEYGISKVHRKSFLKNAKEHGL